MPSIFLEALCEAGLFLLKMRTLRHRAGKCPAQCHRGSLWHGGARGAATLSTLVVPVANSASAWTHPTMLQGEGNGGIPPPKLVLYAI